MSLRSMLCRTAGMAGGLGMVAVALAQPPEKLPIKPAGYIPPTTIPPADAPPQPMTPALPSIARVQLSASATTTENLPQSLAESRAAYAKIRDYTCYLIRQERVRGKVLAEQTAELRVRQQPFAISAKVTAPKEMAGWETSYVTNRYSNKVRFRPAGLEGMKSGFMTVASDDPRVLTESRLPIAETGMQPVLDRVEKALAIEKRMNHPVQVLVADYSFAGRRVTRYEIFADRPHPNRYAARMVLFIDQETKLPVRFEAYDASKTGTGTANELIEMQSFVGLRTNVGLGDSVFDR